MTTLFDPFKKEIAQSIVNALAEISAAKEANIQIKNIYNELTLPPDFSLGQAAFPCFSFAKTLKMPPAKIAEILAEKLNKVTHTFISKIECVNAYLNFHCSFPELAEDFAKETKSGNFFAPHFLDEAEKEKIVVEYSQPNTHKALHVGHLRCLVLGDAVSNLLEYAGNIVVRATYPGDLGTHVAKVIWYLSRLNKNAFPAKEKAHWLGLMYAKADEEIKKIQGTPAEDEMKKKIFTIVEEINKTQGEYFELWKETREWSLSELRRVYTWLNAHFDLWYYESECEEPAKELVRQKFAEGFFVKDAGAIGIDLSPYKLGFALFLKSDGNSLYLTKDLDLIRQKFSDTSVTKSIVVVDSRQKFHFEQLFKTAELMGYPQAAKSVHLAYETVNTEDGKPFSSRELNGLGLMELKKRTEDKVTNSYLERYRGQWSDEEIELTAKNVSIGALKYGMLRVDNNTQIHFSLDEWLRLDGETGPYLQYVHARCQSILEKQGKWNSKEQQKFIFSLQIEKELLFILHRFNDFAVQAALQNRPSHLAGYLYDVAKSFNRFYEACPIRDAEEQVKNTRLFLVESAQKIIRKGLALLGIPAPHKM